MLATAHTALVVKLIAELALMALFGQWLVGLMAGSGRQHNPFYRLLQLLGSPFVRLARLLTPKLVLDRHVPLAAFFMLLFIWLLATVWRIRSCIEAGVDLCR
ncbi:MAG: hypothetical protein OEY75_06185 [Hylemonella sp.]|nr:hypothetical protein [Hylemonella sp.]MDH5708686.1 hypothetical protein [Hylemonella sp.]